MCGLSRSITLGSGLTLSINPGALSQMCGWKNPSILEAINGTGAGGSATFTIGTNTNFVLGPSYNITLEKAKDIDMADSTAAKVISVLLGIFSYVYLAAYGLLAWDIARTCLTILYEILVSAMLLSLMLVLAGREKAGDKWKEAWEEVFKPYKEGFKGVWDFALSIGGMLGNANTVVNQLLPIGAAALGAAATFSTGIADAAVDAKG